MNYFMTDIHGASKAYFEMIDRLNIKNNDELYILGDIFDGNSQNPKACIDILADIMAHENYHLVLGDHEYVHIMYEMSKQEEAVQKIWLEMLMDEDFEGAALHKYIYEKLSEKERNYYFGYLLRCDLTDYVQIGKRIFYLVHGSPQRIKNDNISEWQCDVCMNPINLEKNYQLSILKDPGLENGHPLPKDCNTENTFILCGHIPTTEYKKMVDIEKYGEDATKNKVYVPEIIVYKHKILLDCGCTADELIKEQPDKNLACLAVDAAGYFVTYYRPDIERKNFDNE